MALEKFEKQPTDVQDYDIDFREWLAGFGDMDAGASVVAVADDGITLLSTTLNAGVVKVWLQGGQDGNSYKVTSTLTTTGGRVKQAEIIIKVKEI